MFPCIYIIVSIGSMKITTESISLSNSNVDNYSKDSWIYNYSRWVHNWLMNAPVDSDELTHKFFRILLDEDEDSMLTSPIHAWDTSISFPKLHENLSTLEAHRNLTKTPASLPLRIPFLNHFKIISIWKFWVKTFWIIRIEMWVWN